MSKLNVHSVKVTDPYWVHYLELIRKEMIPYQWDVLNDRADIVIAKERDADYIPSEKSHAIKNFKIAAGLAKGRHYGMVFQDSDVYKWLEAVAYSLRHTYDENLKKTADEVIDLLALAQESDGYLNTYFTIEEPNRRFKRLYQSHELYCAGHYIEAAVAYYTVTQNQKALDVACRLADCIDSVFGEAPDKLKGYDGHEEIELALLRLYEVTGKRNYLELSRFFLYERGKDPGFFKRQAAEDPNKKPLIEGMEQFPPSYYQAHKPVLEQETAEGHAVRVTYLCAAMAKLACLNQDQEMLAACRRLWKNITTKRMYIVGAIGSTVTGEAFTADYDLPNDTMYCETCASIGLIFFAGNMLENEAQGEYADVLERALYNTVLSGLALDGKHFFYVNPLEVVPEYSKKDPGKSHVKVTRPEWFGCACCPPNVARMLTSLDRYIYTVHGHTIYTNLYLTNQAVLEMKGQRVTIGQATEYPWEGKIRFTLATEQPVRFGLAVRIPRWSKTYTVAVNEEVVTLLPQDGYVTIERDWQDGDAMTVELDMAVQTWTANPHVRADLHKVAVQRGPIVYCAEGADNGTDLHLIHVSKDTAFQYRFAADRFGGVGILEADAEKLKIEPEWEHVLYRTAVPAAFSPVHITLIPYYCWANRGENEMLLWFHTK
ncbi:hypothetical protein P22_2863 [Propionispora sp. 2/2-37]|uniref:glycoside hydrolase family 127 protein n=1 Tax=Propionispora sp. 2/2-37 TaxID=1677858 RepID=UPI0006BB931D|nr:beta-L-arabinofuranosidase domain-containing protein [Propionispora sp. 2/2-37]CUH96752.1 hypothetical protein P22_2863 [Propionispora sp. 2/2-37]